MKAALAIFAVFVVVAALAGKGGSDDQLTAATADYSSNVSSDADQVVDLTDEGLELVEWMTDWSTAGTTDPATACGQLTTAEGNVQRLAGIVNEIDQFDSVPSDDVESLRSTHAELERSVSGVASACAALGF